MTAGTLAHAPQAGRSGETTALKPGMSVSDWKPLDKNTLRGYLHADLAILIHGCMLHEKNGSRWVGLPAREYQTNGGRNFARIIAFASKQLHDEFQAAALEALDAAGDPMTRHTWIDFVFSEQPDLATRIKALQAHIAWQQRIRRAAKAKANR